jgi:histidine triad (HIT) family protein
VVRVPGAEAQWRATALLAIEPPGPGPVVDASPPASCQADDVPSCPFCAIVAGADAHRVIDDGEVVGFLDLRPVFEGHVLLIPRTHRQDLADATPAELTELLVAAQRVAAAQGGSLGATGAWVSINHRVSQSVPHLHVHVVPRTKGDGLRGFFWPRTKYADDEAAAAVAARLRAALG